MITREVTQETERQFKQPPGTVDDRMIELYDELRSLAAKYLRREFRQLMRWSGASITEKTERTTRRNGTIVGYHFSPVIV